MTTTATTKRFDSAIVNRLRSLAEVEISPEMVRAHGLSDGEFDDIVAILGRRPTLVELSVFSVMWSEHCCYKSSRALLR
ncbi:MAG: hypothetical protein GY856_37465, partial [bacterium]|nr:hypothetical protein [bacterium]